MNALLIVFLILLDTSWSTYSICSDPRNSGGTTHFSHPTNCAKFIICNWGQPTEQDCPGGTLWNDVVKTCDHARNVRCRSRQLENTFVPSNQRSPGCPRVANGHRPVYAPHQDCSRFYLCTALRPQEMLCSPGAIWNTISNRCEWSGSTDAIPSHSPRSTPLLTTSSRPTTTTPKISTIGCPKVINSAKPVFLPHSECTRFYICTSKGPMELNCIEGYHWSVRTNRCEVPWDAGCIDINAVAISKTTPKVSTLPTTTQSTGRMDLRCPVGSRWNNKYGCIPVELTSTISTSSGVSPVLQSTTTASSTAYDTDATTEPDEEFTTDVPIFG